MSMAVLLIRNRCSACGCRAYSLIHSRPKWTYGSSDPKPYVLATAPPPPASGT